MKLLQILFIALGLGGFGLSYYLVTFRPTLPAVPVAATASTLLLFVAMALPSARLVAYGQQGIATVNKIECESGKKHRVYYQFLAGKKLIKEVGPDGYGNPLCASLHPGDPGVVTYLPGEPEVQVWGLAGEYLGERLLACLFALVLVPIVAYAGTRKAIAATQEQAGVAAYFKRLGEPNPWQ
jgi:hypothetical protein